MKLKLDILLEDEHLVIVDKPSGLLSIPDRYQPDLPNLKAILKKKYGNIFTVHRLDLETSGAICFAKTEEVHKALNQIFQERRVEKIYWAVVDGLLPEGATTIDAPLKMGPDGIVRVAKPGKGKEAFTEVRPLEYFRAATLAEVQIHTGRTHQIRVHLKHIGFPLFVDRLYGRRPKFFLSELKGRKYNLGKYKEERPLVSRSTLHARSLTFQHPVTGRKVVVKAELPKDMRALVTQLRKN